ncbi:1-aminocyclopropane-1-carboxylate synthase-like [Cucumis sativus]|uniref:1-aminocyclopropane-1-carboxylate synthase n=1 Tax=Cucumis sativus TaxID=3659 RepID=O82124_CUCSA|nr:1-aminocyclopropane-1-carboxylate synthase-like [Cucumis sativus]BAA33375.1 ACC synthase [Cucumis sativus]BAA93715.1 1-aminocyclopropane-1-carboxylate synthase [Cucumis sativus]
MVLVSSNDNGNAKKVLSKLAKGNGHGEDSSYFDGWKAYDSDPFHPIINPRGVIQMGLAENQLSFEFVEKWMKNNPRASICSVEGIDEFKDIAIFQDYHGLPEFRNAVANFMGKVRGNRVKFDPDRVVMSGGATGAHETMAFCLADPGEAFLVPVPYYPGFDRDLRWRTGVEIVPVICESSNNFKLTREALETAYEEAQKSNIKIKGLLITNPSNPLGTVYDRQTLETAVSFINEKNIHLVCDEIYAATVFAEPGFISISEVIDNSDIECDRNLVHVVYSLSKDMGFPGFRVGIIYSYNDAVVACARKMSSFGLVSSQTQYLIASMLLDDVFVDNFLAGSAEKLAARHRNFTKGLAQVGIGYLKGSGGLFLWMDLRHLLKEKTLEAEMALWKVIINEVKLNVSPGSSFHCSEPGWFRVCFANMDDNTMDISITRIRNFVLQNKEVTTKVKKQKFCWRQSSLELRLSSRRLEDIMSPHSPLPQSPMHRATT